MKIDSNRTLFRYGAFELCSLYMLYPIAIVCILAGKQNSSLVIPTQITLLSRFVARFETFPIGWPLAIVILDTISTFSRIPFYTQLLLDPKSTFDIELPSEIRTIARYQDIPGPARHFFTLQMLAVLVFTPVDR